MKRKLILLAVLLVCAIGFAQNQITAVSAPATAAVGGNITAGFTYDAAIAGTCQIQLFKTDAAGNIDYSAGTDIVFTSSVPAGIAQTVTGTFTVSNTVAPTNTLPAGQVYKWFYKLTVGGTDYYGSNVETTITSASVVQNQITATSAVVTARVGENIIAGFTYDATADGTCQIQLFKTFADGNINYGAATDVLFVGPISAGTGMTIAPTFIISNTVMPTNTLPAGQVYKWFFKLSVGGTDYYGSNLETTITPGFSSVTVTGTAPFNYVYDGAARSPSFTKTGSTAALTYVYTGTGIAGSSAIAPANAGNYSVTASVASDASYSAASSTATAFTISDVTTWTTTGTPSWDYGTPTALLNAVIDGTYSSMSNGAFTAKKLTVNSSKSLIINSGTNVTVQNEVINNGTLVVENNANLIQVNDVANTGSIIVNRNSNALKRLDYTLWSSPVMGAQTLAGFSPLTSQSPSRFYIYDYTQGTAGLYASVSPSIPFTTGTGYLIRMPNEDPANLGLGTPYYLGSSALTYNGVFTGTPNNGTVTLGIPIPLASNKYYAVGNPYPSTISASAFLLGNTTDGTLYFWRKTNMVANSTGSAYATWTTLGAAASNVAPNDIVPNGTIQVGQGFIVKTGPAATTLAFTNAMRISNNDNQIFKTKQVVQKDRIWLNLTDTNGVFSQALIGYMDGATVGVDNGIDGKYINDSPIALTSKINNEEYTIQGRPTFDVSDVVALNFKTDVAGDYTIAIDHADGLFASGQAIYLVDSKTGTETNLKTSSYNFTAVSGVDNTRFSLKYQKTLKVDDSIFNENSVTAYAKNGTLYVNSGEMAINSIEVYDVQGRLIAERKKVKATTATLENLKANNQVLLVKVSGENNQVVTKKIMN